MSLFRQSKISPLVRSNRIRYSSSSLRFSSKGSSRRSQYSFRSANGAGSFAGKVSNLSANVVGQTLVKPKIPLQKQRKKINQSSFHSTEQHTVYDSWNQSIEFVCRVHHQVREENSRINMVALVFEHLFNRQEHSFQNRRKLPVDIRLRRATL